MEQERITAAAIKVANKSLSTYPMVLTAFRHCDIFELMRAMNIREKFYYCTQGFWTSNDRFVDRIEAKKIAVAANQLIVPLNETYNELYSEDVW